MWMVKADRNKGHKVGYSEVRWYFTRKQDAQQHATEIVNSRDRHGAFMYGRASVVELTNGMKETF